MIVQFAEVFHGGFTFFAAAHFQLKADTTISIEGKP